MSILQKLKKNSTIKDSDILSESKFFNAKDMIQTAVPMINVALSGKLDGGLTPGLTVFAGPSKHFKTAFALLLAKSYMKTLLFFFMTLSLVVLSLTLILSELTLQEYYIPPSQTSSN